MGGSGSPASPKNLPAAWPAALGPKPSVPRRLHLAGSGRYGQLGIPGDTADKDEPTAVDAPAAVTAGWAAVAAGGDHTCAIASGTRALYCFGSGSSGQLGTAGNTADMYAPTAVTVPAAVTAGWAAVSAGVQHTCAISNGTDTLFCFGAWELCCPGRTAARETTALCDWIQHPPSVAMRPAGYGGSGQLGISGDTADKTSPTAATVPLGWTGGWAALSAGSQHTCALVLGRY